MATVRQDAHRNFAIPVLLVLLGALPLALLVDGHMLFRSAPHVGQGAATKGRSPVLATTRAAMTSHVPFNIPPICPPAAESLSTSISISIGPSASTFDEGCYYVPANVPLTVSFQNTITAQSSGQVLSASLLISPMSNPAVFAIANPKMPTVLGTGSGMFGVDPRNAVFVGPEVASFNPSNFSVPPLSAGTYIVQLQEFPLAAATLIVMTG